MRYTVSRLFSTAIRTHPAFFCSGSVRRFTTLPVAKPNTKIPRHGITQLKIIPRAVPYIRLFSTSSALCGDFKALQENSKKKSEEHEQHKLQNTPAVSTSSTVRDIFEPSPTPRHSNAEPDTLRDIKSELNTVKETFALRDVPSEAFWVGIAGLTPYVITSFSTLYLAWDINYVAAHGMGNALGKETATNLLHFLEPTQIGLGAIILSFLGAVHWGLEMAEYGGKHPYRRYTIAVLAPALAWPTVLLPLDYALLTQFVGFVGMYFADTTATFYGWVPKWYATYRFILTFIVGACIIITLIGRGQIGDSIQDSGVARKHLQDIRNSQRGSARGGEAEYKRFMAAEEGKVRQDRHKQNGEGQEADPRKNVKGPEGKQEICSDEVQGKTGVKGDTNGGHPPKGDLGSSVYPK